jgi:hypothetical protein
MKEDEKGGVCSEDDRNYEGIQNFSLKSWIKWFTWLILCVYVCITTHFCKISLLAENDKIGRCPSRTNPENTLVFLLRKLGSVCPPPSKKKNKTESRVLINISNNPWSNSIMWG